MTCMPPFRTLQAAHVALAEVTSVQDPEDQGRIQVKLLSQTAAEGQDATVWARVAVPFAAGNNGAFLIPDLGSTVVVGFLNADPRYPVVLGALWHGGARPPERLDGSTVDRWSITGKAGTRIAIEEKSGDQPAVKLSTPGGVEVSLLDQGSRLVCTAGGATVTLSPAGVTIETGGKVEVQASTMKVSAGMVTVDAGMSSFSGVVKCDTLIATTVVASTYTPGAGNVW